MTQADVCLILEGTYPYTLGGVSSWTQSIIEGFPELTFYLISMVPTKEGNVQKYTLPKNVVGMDHIYLQDMDLGEDVLDVGYTNELFQIIEKNILQMQFKPRLKDMQMLMDCLEKSPKKLGKKVLLNSDASWKMSQRIYRSSIGDGSFINYFWSLRSLLSGFMSTMLMDLPDCHVYHSFCTGFAGLLLAKARLKTGRPCLVTEHGIYTNERRIEISSATWLNEQSFLDLQITKKSYQFSVKDMWTETFSGYSRLCYEVSDKIITLFKDNQECEIVDGADPEKMLVIPNGIDIEKFGFIEREASSKPVVALIGRVVQVKDVKTFIKAVALLKEKMPEVEVYILGPFEEDSEYFHECIELARFLKIEEEITFTGQVDITSYLPKIDVAVLTSISEAQPLASLEAGACGIPSVMTNVGSCYDIAHGDAEEHPRLGQGGVVVPLVNPDEVAAAIYRLLSDPEFYQQCSQAIRQRVKKYYAKSDMLRKYREIYSELIIRSKNSEESWQESALR